MPKPTFLQAVLKKPTRSYADPYHSSPWSDQDPAQSSSYYTSSSSSRYDEQYNQYNHAGPSKPRSRGPSSTMSASTMSDVIPNNNISMGSRFPKPARRVVSNVTLRDGQLIHDSPPRSSSSAVGPTRKKPIKASSINRIEEDGRPVSRAGTVKKKKKPKSTVNENDSILSSPTSTTMSLPMPPPILSRNSETFSSAPSSPVPPLSPVTSTHSEAIRQKPGRPNYSKPPLPLLTPPSSETSTPNSSTQHMQTIEPPSERTPKVQINQVQAPQVIVGNADSDSDDEVFYTPRTSLEDLQLPTPTSTESENLRTPRPTNPSIAPPSFNFLPPTPAPIPDPAQSPFHSEPSSSSSSLHPDRPFVSRQSSKIEVPPIQTNIEPQIPSGADEDDDVQSASGQAGSDEEKESERQGRFDRAVNEVWSRPSSVVGRSTPPSLDGYGSRAPSRQSTSRHVSRNPSDEFPGVRRPSIPASEASYSSAPNRPEGSIRGSGSISGYGKGGWAAAHSARSRPSSPVMFMPAAGDGWADFQPPPPRQSKFTPLPSASLSPTFDRITDGSRLPISGPSSRASQNDYNGGGGGGLRPPSRGDSSPSEYSQLSDGLEMPSRSYVKNRSSHASQSTTISDGGRQAPKPEPGSLAFPIARVGSLSISHSATSPSLARPPSRVGSETYPSRPMSPSMDFSRPTSPMMSGRPPSVLSQSTSPMTFNPPSFLNPDLLTILPEMTNEDSDRLYRPTRSESGRGKRNSMQDWASHNPSRRSSIFRAKSEVGHHDDYQDARDVPELPARRSKSVIGFRNHDYTKDRERDRKWEGSSYGDGVLMESNGRAPESVGGYTNLVLPSGAYRPNNPAKSNALDSRILGMPHATMASIVLTTTFARHSSTPAHLRDQLPPLVDFSSHLKPPTKVGDSQLLVQVYAVAIDQVDVRALDERARWEVGKYVPGRSFVGRALVVGADEKEVVRGDLVIGILDIRKSGALSEYIAVDRRRISRAPFPTHLSLEQLSLLPLQGIAAARAVRTHLIRNSRALILNAHEGVAALVCQEMSRSGVNITAVIPGGDHSHEHHKLCIENGAKGVLMGSPAAVMLSLEEGAWDFVFDSVGGVRVGDAARRLLRDGGRLISTIKSDSSSSSPTNPTLTSRPSGLKSLKAAFGGSNSRRKDSKFVSVEYLPPTGSGEPEVDSSGMDYRDIMEEPCMAIFRPVLHEYINRKNSMMPSGEGETVRTVVNFEKGQEVFRRDWEGVRVVRVIN